MKVVVGDDDPFTRRYVIDLLEKQGYQTVAATDGQEAWNALEPPHKGGCIAILNCRLPRIEGIELLHRIRTLRHSNTIYVIMVAPMATRDEAIKSVDTGADDFMIKPLDAQQLRVRLRCGKRILDLETALKMQNTRDPLTGTMNRVAILEALRQEVARARRSGAPLGLLLVELDHFKRVSMNYSHFAGDTVLVDVLERVRGLVREYDLVGRTAESEFLIVLPGCSLGNAEQQAKRLCSHIGGKPFQAQQHAINLTCSVGVTSTEIAPQIEADSLLRVVVGAALRAQQHGGNTVEAGLSVADIPPPGTRPPTTNF